MILSSESCIYNLKQQATAKMKARNLTLSQAGDVDPKMLWLIIFKLCLNSPRMFNYLDVFIICGLIFFLPDQQHNLEEDKENIPFMCSLSWNNLYSIALVAAENLQTFGGVGKVTTNKAHSFFFRSSQDLCQCFPKPNLLPTFMRIISEMSPNFRGIYIFLPHSQFYCNWNVRNDVVEKRDLRRILWWFISCLVLSVWV